MSVLLTIQNVSLLMVILLALAVGAGELYKHYGWSMSFCLQFVAIICVLFFYY